MVSELSPTSAVNVRLKLEATVGLPICYPKFLKWAGDPPPYGFGGKPLIDYKNECVFAELAILKMLFDDGWDGVWVETYGGCNYLQTMPLDSDLKKYSVPIPKDKKELLEKIWGDGRRACFDVMAWKGEDIVFYEAKHGKDKPTPGQLRFIENAIACGIKKEQLIIVHWSYR
jgi:hypothetical protein